MNRRTLLKGITALTAGLVLPPTLGENVEAARRYWALDGTMVPREWGPFARWVEAYEPKNYKALAYYSQGVTVGEGNDAEFISLSSGQRYADVYAALSPHDQRLFPKPPTP